MELGRLREHLVMEKAGNNSFTLKQQTMVRQKKKKNMHGFAQKALDHRTLMLDLWINARDIKEN